MLGQYDTNIAVLANKEDMESLWIPTFKSEKEVVSVGWTFSKDNFNWPLDWLKDRLKRLARFGQTKRKRWVALRGEKSREISTCTRASEVPAGVPRAVGEEAGAGG